MNKRLVIGRVESLSHPTTFEGLGQMGSCTLPPHAVAITDESHSIVAVPGVTGSKTTKAHSGDVSITLEIANFDAESVARNAFALNYRSPSSKLYSGELENTLSKLALIKYNAELSEIGAEITQIYSHTFKKDTYTPIECSLEWIFSRISHTLTDEMKNQVIEGLSQIGTYDSGVFYPHKIYSIIKNKYDILQEVIRLVDFSSIKDVPLRGGLINSDISKTYSALYTLKNYIVSLGCTEIVSRPFVAKESLISPDNAVTVVNPSSSLEPYVSDSLIPRLLDAYHQNIGKHHNTIFEINTIFSHTQDTLHESKMLCILLESVDAIRPTTLANSLFSFVNTQPCRSFNTTVTHFGNTTTYHAPVNGLHLSLTQVSKKVLKTHDIPLTKTLWALEMPVDHIDNKGISHYRNYIDQNKYITITRTVNVDVSEKKAIEWVDLIKAHDIWEITCEMSSLYHKDGCDLVSLNLHFNNPHENITSNQVDEYIKHILQ